ncbi:gliding motility-associated C-terminal domain-containing protein, partial [Flavobacterium rhamnosiphilum]
CGNILTASTPDISTTPACEGTITYTYTFTDCKENTHNWVYTYTIERADFTMPDNDGKTVACTADIVAPTVPAVTDNCENTLTASTPVISTNPTSEGNVTYTYTFTDCEGTAHNWVYTYTIDDTIPPTIPVLADVSGECTVTVVAPTTTDNCAGIITATTSDPLTYTSEGTFIIHWNFNDGNGNNIIVNQNVIVDCGGVVLACGKILVHNAFSPNGDGINEVFVIDNIGDACNSDNTVEIYNRWGVLVFETRNYNNESNYFDGVSRGRTTISQSSGLPTGTYFYILNYTSVDNDGKIITNKKDGYLYLTK